jgi:AraC family transcriptional regulator
MATAIKVEDVHAELVAAVRRQVMYPDVPRELIAGLDVVWAFIRGRDLQHGHNVALYRALGGNAVDMTCAVQVTARFDPHGEIECVEMPAGRAAAAMHVGPYAKLGETHRAVAQWALGSGHRLAGISWEVYDDPVDDPEKLRTGVYMLLASG